MHCTMLIVLILLVLGNLLFVFAVFTLRIVFFGGVELF